MKLQKMQPQIQNTWNNFGNLLRKFAFYKSCSHDEIEKKMQPQIQSASFLRCALSVARREIEIKSAQILQP